MTKWGLKKRYRTNYRGSYNNKYKRKSLLSKFPPLLKFLIFCFLIGGIGWGVDRSAPHQHLPWRTLGPDRPLGMATKMQLMKVQFSSNEKCRYLAVTAENLSSVPAEPKRIQGKPCGWDVARVHFGSEAVPLSPGEATMQCPLSLGNYIWSREIDRAAQKRFGANLTEIYHAGTYSCRRQRGNGSSAWSEHAFANAFDVTGFKLSDGQVISVLKDWDGERKKQRFLRDVRDAACRIFRVTLSPDFNAAHADHFHVDMGPSRSCR